MKESRKSAESKVRLFCYSVTVIVSWELWAFRVFIYANERVNVWFGPPRMISLVLCIQLSEWMKSISVNVCQITFGPNERESWSSCSRGSKGCRLQNMMEKGRITFCSASYPAFVTTQSECFPVAHYAAWLTSVTSRPVLPVTFTTTTTTPLKSGSIWCAWGRFILESSGRGFCVPLLFLGLVFVFL